MISKLKKSAGPTSTAESATTFHRFSDVSGVRSMCLCKFSINTTAPSIMAPIAMAIPASDMMLAFIPCQFMMMKAVRMPIGRLIIATSAERRWNRKSTHTNATMASSSSRPRNRLSTAFSIKPERS